jgi:DNA (cytosine-5)-methyltransferase 1
VRKNKTINGLSLFANVGIGETYIHKHGVKIKVANEFLKDRCDFYRHLHPDVDVIEGDITDRKIYNKIIKRAKEHKCEFILATPPCQGMSIARGKKNPEDERNLLIKYVMGAIKDLNPKYVIIENVPTMLDTEIKVGRKTLTIEDYIKGSLERLGKLKGRDEYFVNHLVIDAAHYGTPQHRRRVIFLISNVARWEFPNVERIIPLKEVIRHLPSLEAGEESPNDKYHKAPKHNEKHVEWMRHTPEGRSAFDNKVHYPKVKDKESGNYRRIKGYSTTYKRMSWDKPAPTVTMGNGSISSQNNVHPGRPTDVKGIYSDARVLTLRELFIITGLPDDWEPPEWAEDSLTRKVIGECFLPRLVERLVEVMPRK